MSDNQQQGQGSNVVSSSQPDTSQQSQSGQQGQQGGKPLTPGGSNPSGIDQPNSQQDQSGRGDQQGSGLDEEDITESPRRDSAQQGGDDDANRSSGQQSR
ncbi:MAG: hypothetical protein M3N82_00215 [Pseudomonadota bacterium]|nr:hypothetical protein [Pseudomonadota bacterium]